MYAPGSLGDTIDETQRSASRSKIVHPNEKGSKKKEETLSTDIKEKTGFLKKTRSK